MTAFDVMAEKFHLTDTPTDVNSAAPARKAGRVNLLNWDGATTLGLFPDAPRPDGHATAHAGAAARGSGTVTLLRRLRDETAQARAARGGPVRRRRGRPADRPSATPGVAHGVAAARVPRCRDAGDDRRPGPRGGRAAGARRAGARLRAPTWPAPSPVSSRGRTWRPSTCAGGTACTSRTSRTATPASGAWPCRGSSRRSGKPAPSSALRKGRRGEHELPDHLPVVLEFAAGVQPGMGRRLLVEYLPVLELLRRALREAASPYAGVLDAVCSTLPPLGAADLRRVAELAAQGPPAEEVGPDGYGMDPALDEHLGGRR